jgi:hypothetical protein
VRPRHVLLLLLGDQLVEPGAPGLVEGVVGALVEGELLALQMQDRADRAVEEVAVVADHQHGVGIFREEVLEPDRALEVEVVGRLVEQQHVGPREEHGGECDAHAPAAGEVGAGSSLSRGVEAEAGEDRRGAGLGGMRLDIGEAHLDLGDAVGVGRGFRFRQQRGAFGIGLEHGVDQARLRRRGLLRHAADPGAAGDLDLAGIGGELAPDQPEERGLAGAVAPDEPDLVAGRDQRRGIVEETLALEREGEVPDREHGRACGPRRGRSQLGGRGEVAAGGRAGRSWERPRQVTSWSETGQGPGAVVGRSTATAKVGVPRPGRTNLVRMSRHGDRGLG